MKIINAITESGYPVSFRLVPHPMVPGHFYLFIGTTDMFLSAACESYSHAIALIHDTGAAVAGIDY